jgi:hypothetical protein
MHLRGGCHCGNIAVAVELTTTPELCHPRACDCDFCRRHGAAYVSDPNGSLVIEIRDQRALTSYRQGSEQAEMLLCRNCGVLIGAVYRHPGGLYATINSKILETTVRFASEQPVSPRKLSPEDKVKRWQDIWFSKVRYPGGSSDLQ